MSVESVNEVATAAMGPGASLMSLAPMVLIFVIFYFFLIRPQLKRQRQVEEMVSNLKKGDKVVAAGGVMGVINKIEDSVVTLEIADGIKINVLKSSVTECKSSDAKTLQAEQEPVAPNKEAKAEVKVEKKEVKKAAKPVAKKAQPKKAQPKKTTTKN